MAQKKEPGSGTDLASIVKWIVLGVIAMTALVFFRPQIGNLLNRTSDLEISKSGLKIKTIQTPLGEAEVSNVSVKSSEIDNDGVQGNMYISRKHHFLITWPAGETWTASQTMGSSLKDLLKLPVTIEIPIVVVKNSKVGDFQPNVNVTIEPIGSMTAAAYMKASIEQIRQQGWTLLESSVDEPTQGGFLSFSNNTLAKPLYQFQRIAIANGNAYVITASQVPPEDALSRQLREELLGILNSFRVIM